jgi:hypothetical protein
MPVGPMFPASRFPAAVLASAAGCGDAAAMFPALLKERADERDI